MFHAFLSQFHPVSLLFLLSGSVPPHECVRSFFVDLTPESVAAVMDAKKKVASHWRSTFASRSNGAPLRKRKRRAFRVAKCAVAMSKKKNHSGKNAGKTQKKTSQKISVKKALPSKKLALAGTQTVENIPENYTRSEKGNRLIKQQMMTMLERDKVSFPDRPMFDMETNKCRAKFLGFPLLYFYLFFFCILKMLHSTWIWKGLDICSHIFFGDG